MFLRPSPNSARITNLFLSFSLVAIGRLARINSKLKIERIPIVLLTVSITGFHMVREADSIIVIGVLILSLLKDMQTLSRMTGKDFSGPTPEILAPAVLSLSEPDKPEDDQPLEGTRKKSTTPGMASDGAVVLGDVSSFDKDGDA
jgi:hypothetical protein